MILSALMLSGQTFGQEREEPSKTEEFLSDNSRVGAVVGSVLLGAATANPLAPLIGNVAGFLIGAYFQSDSPDEDDADSGFARRSIIPSGNEQLQASASTPSMDLSGAGDSESLVRFDESAQEATGDFQPAESNASEATIRKGSSGANPMASIEKAREPINLVITKEVGGTQEKLDELAATIRKEQNRKSFEPHPRCPSDQSPRYRKKVAVAGFSLANPDQTVFGGLGEVETSFSSMLYREFRNGGSVQPFSAPSRQMFASLDMAPTRSAYGNRLDKYSAVSREMGVQFVISGVIRNIGVDDRSAWDNSYSSRLKRSLFSADTTRAFVVDVVVHDGYTGRVVVEETYSTSGRWDLPMTKKAGFGSPSFQDTAYGKAVADLVSYIQADLTDRLACQPMLVPILEVKGKDLLLDVGTPSGLLPGDRLQLVRAEHSLQRPDAPPELWDTGVDLHIHSLSLSTSRAWMHAEGGAINIREGDYAVIY